jgi:hypothetical protein
MVPRSATRDSVLVSSDGKEYFMPKGASIITNITYVCSLLSYRLCSSVCRP